MNERRRDEINARLCVRYSISHDYQNDGTRYLRQLEASVTSLRQLYKSIPIIVFSYGPLPESTELSLSNLGVHRIRKEPYELRLTRLVAPSIARVLSAYPCPHRFLDLDHPSMGGSGHVLQVDCDTVFF